MKCTKALKYLGLTYIKAKTLALRPRIPPDEVKSTLRLSDDEFREVVRRTGIYPLSGGFSVTDLKALIFYCLALNIIEETDRKVGFRRVYKTGIGDRVGVAEDKVVGDQPYSRHIRYVLRAADQEDINAALIPLINSDREYLNARKSMQPVFEAIAPFSEDGKAGEYRALTWSEFQSILEYYKLKTTGYYPEKRLEVLHSMEKRSGHFEFGPELLFIKRRYDREENAEADLLCNKIVEFLRLVD